MGDSVPYLYEISVFVIFYLGACFGSFANVVILRLPDGKSVVRPRSRCPKCQNTISWYDNIPILSWFILRGKCRKCSALISWRYPMIEVLTAVLFVALFVRYGWSWTQLEYTIFAFGLIIVTFIDFDHMILPDIFTLSGIVIGLVGAALNPEREFWSAVVGVIIGGGFLWMIAYIYYLLRKEEGMGGGDIKLLAWIGAVLGWNAIPFVILTASFTGSFVGLVVAYKSKEGMKAAIPFGPYLALGAVVYILGGQFLANWYLGLFIPSLSPVN